MSGIWKRVKAIILMALLTGILAAILLPPFDSPEARDRREAEEYFFNQHLEKCRQYDRACQQYFEMLDKAGYWWHPLQEWDE